MEPLQLNMSNDLQNQLILDGINLNQMRKTRHQSLFHITFLIFFFKALLIFPIFIIYWINGTFNYFMIILLIFFLFLYLICIKSLLDSKKNVSNAKSLFLQSIICFILEIATFFLLIKNFPTIEIIIRDMNLVIEIILIYGLILYFLSSLFLSRLYYQKKEKESRFFLSG